jgi:hypothetical protein
MRQSIIRDEGVHNPVLAREPPSIRRARLAFAWQARRGLLSFSPREEVGSPRPLSIAVLFFGHPGKPAGVIPYLIKWGAPHRRARRSRLWQVACR